MAYVMSLLGQCIAQSMAKDVMRLAERRKQAQYLGCLRLTTGKQDYNQQCPHLFKVVLERRHALNWENTPTHHLFFVDTVGYLRGKITAVPTMLQSEKDKFLFLILLLITSVERSEISDFNRVTGGKRVEMLTGLFNSEFISRIMS
jgi:hypothetical protein